MCLIWQLCLLLLLEWVRPGLRTCCRWPFERTCGRCNGVGQCSKLRAAQVPLVLLLVVLLVLQWCLRLQQWQRQQRLWRGICVG